MPLKIIKKDDLEITYNLEIKKVKNINMRIKTSGEVLVSAHKNIPFSKIDEFVLTRFEQIYKLQNEIKPEKYVHKYINGEIFKFFGQDFVLEVIEGENFVYMSEDTIYLTVLDTENFLLKEKLFNQNIDKLCQFYFNNLSDEVYEKFKEFNIQKPIIKMRKMKSRWGSCNITKKIITLNKLLIKYPVETMKSVVIHEYCHFLEPNHSAKFYKLMEYFMPNYKQIEACLKDEKFW